MPPGQKKDYADMTMKSSSLLKSQALASISAALLVSCCALTAAGAGPDVIVGELPDVSNYTSGGAIGGKRSYSVGTTSCNIGDQPLLWISSTNQHPVISGNMYRLLNGRFEQIGQSWLKHGFTALQGTVCDTCSGQWPNGSRLGVGCSDPYSSGLNGSQGGLGPKSEVNASTGNFPYPWVNRGSSTNELGKRLVVNDTDIGIAGAQHFVASMYVAPDDALAGNSNNNQSFRPISVGANKSIALTGSTQRTKPAIFAWKENGLGAGIIDPDVQLVAADVPNDGRFWIGVKATNLGSGQWRYEYAVQNFTSHRSGQSFSIPLPAGAVVTNIGFHDVDYHSGEPFSGTDWTSAVGPSNISWSTQTFTQNSNANALRFDTLYNFRFDCNLPPSNGAATIGLFRSGPTPSISAASVVPSLDGNQHPFNDDCSAAIAIGSGATAFSSNGATTDGPDAPGPCTVSGYSQVGSDIWYTYSNGNCAGSMTISTCGSSYDTKLAVYASCPTGSGQAIACSDNAAGCANSGSSVTFPATPNTTYTIRVGGHNGLTGTGSLLLTPPDCTPPGLFNETCNLAQFIPAGVIVDGTTIGARDDGDGSCGSSNNSPDVWFRYRPVTSGSVTYSTCDTTTNFDTVLSIFSGSCGNLVELGCNDDSCGLRTNVVVNNSVAGVDYFIRATGFSGSTGNFKLKITGGGGVVPPPNDLCANRPGIGLGSTPFSTLNATTDGPTHTGCSFFGNNNITNDVWFNYPSLCDGDLTIATCSNAAWDTKIAVYGAYGCDNLDARLLACSDDDCGNQSTVTIPVAAGDFITIRVGGYIGATGSGNLVLTCTAPCLADFNQDGGVDGTDVEAFFLSWSGGQADADLDQSGGIDGADVDLFFQLWSFGC